MSVCTVTSGRPSSPQSDAIGDGSKPGSAVSRKIGTSEKDFG